MYPAGELAVLRQLLFKIELQIVNALALPQWGYFNEDSGYLPTEKLEERKKSYFFIAPDLNKVYTRAPENRRTKIFISLNFARKHVMITH